MTENANLQSIPFFLLTNLPSLDLAIACLHDMCYEMAGIAFEILKSYI